MQMLPSTSTQKLAPMRPSPRNRPPGVQKSLFGLCLASPLDSFIFRMNLFVLPFSASSESCLAEARRSCQAVSLLLLALTHAAITTS